jgi:hypothetical protein
VQHKQGGVTGVARPRPFDDHDPAGVAWPGASDARNIAVVTGVARPGPSDDQDVDVVTGVAPPQPSEHREPAVVSGVARPKAV